MMMIGANRSRALEGFTDATRARCNDRCGKNEGSSVLGGYEDKDTGRQK
jgi:hypothetical protein